VIQSTALTLSSVYNVSNLAEKTTRSVKTRALPQCNPGFNHAVRPKECTTSTCSPIDADTDT